MTFKQIAVGSALGLAIVAAALLTQLPSVVATAGLFVVIVSMILGGADGTLPPRVHR